MVPVGQPSSVCYGLTTLSEVAACQHRNSSLLLASVAKGCLEPSRDFAKSHNQGNDLSIAQPKATWPAVGPKVANYVDAAVICAVTQDHGLGSSASLDQTHGLL